MPNLLLGNPMQSFNEGAQIGRQNRFNALAGQAVAASPDQRAGFLAQAAQADPRQAVALGSALTEQDDSAEDRRNKTLVNMARFYVNAPDSAKGQVRAQLAPALASLGIDATTATPEQFDQTAKAIVSAWTPGNAVASGTREFEASAAAAGLKPGTPEYEQAAKIGLGLAPRAVTAAAKTGMITGADGRERPYTFDPQTQAYKVFDGGVWRPLGQDEAAQVGVASTSAGQPTATPRPAAQDKVQAILAQATQMANEGGPGANAPAAEAWAQQQFAANGIPYSPNSSSLGAQASQAPAATGGLGVGRAPEETAGAVQNAKNASDLAYLPETNRVNTDSAVDRAGREAAAKAAAEAASKQGQDFQQRHADAQKTLSDLDEVDRLLPQATGGRVGSAVDSAAAAFNHSTDTAKASAQLDILAGRLTSAVPRMQGPQSDRDVELYQKQAGDLANRNLPIATRQAAAKEIRRLQMKYLDDPYGNGSVSTSNQPQVSWPSSDSTGKDFSHLW